MRRKRIEEWGKGMTGMLLFICLVLCVLLFKAYLDGKFHSVETLREYVAGFGIMAPLVLTAIQAAQVVLPVLPGFFGCIVGAVMFGWMGGFWCNYIGISLGPLAEFLLARRYGQGLVTHLFPGESYQKWANWAAKSKSYTTILLLGMILPLFPDDYFCYFTGVTNMSTRKFTTIIILGKPWCILAYSLIFSGVITI